MAINTKSYSYARLAGQIVQHRTSEEAAAVLNGGQDHRLFEVSVPVMIKRLYGRVELHLSVLSDSCFDAQ